MDFWSERNHLPAVFFQFFSVLGSSGRLSGWQLFTETCPLYGVCPDAISGVPPHAYLSFCLEVDLGALAMDSAAGSCSAAPYARSRACVDYPDGCL